MIGRRAVWVAWSLVIGWCAAFRPTAGEAAEPAATRAPLVLAHYMAWYEAPPRASAWGWHWTMNHFDPKQQVDGRRQIASKLHPAIEPYDSGDDDVIEYHLLLMKLAGIDGVIIDWYGRERHYDYAIIHANACKVVDRAEALGLVVAVCYEDRILAELVKAGKLADDGKVGHVAGDLAWLEANWFPRKHYARFDGRPLVLSFGRDGLGDAGWSQAIEQFGRPVAYCSQQMRRPGAAGGFDWPVPSQGLEPQQRFGQMSRDWPLRIPVAFPRFLDIYAEAKVHPSWGSIPDDDGRTFRSTLAQAGQLQAAFVQLATWNDWGEGTVIEPSVEYGTRDLEYLQSKQRRRRPELEATAADLALPGRLLALRRAAKTPEQKAAAAALGDALATGDLAAARRLAAP